MNQDQRDALRSSIEDLLTDFIHREDMLTGGDLGLPVIGDWVLVAVVDDASDLNQGGNLTIQPKAQWRHRTVGLLTMAADDYRSITKTEDD